MFGCLKNLISVGEKCGGEVGQPCAVFSFNDIPWYLDVRANQFVDNRYENLSEWKENMIRLAAIELGNEITGYLGSNVTLKENLDYFNGYGSADLGTVSSQNSKGISFKKTCLGAVKMRLEKICFYTKNIVIPHETNFFIQVDGVSKPYEVILDSSGVNCIGLVCDENGDPITARESILIYINDDLGFVQHSIICQTGCHGTKKNNFVSVTGVHGQETSAKRTYGIEAVVTSFCDYSDLICFGMNRDKMAELLMYKLEYKVAEYAMSSNRTDMFKQSFDIVKARLDMHSENYPAKFNAYVDPMLKVLASNPDYTKCVNCNGVSYGYNG